MSKKNIIVAIDGPAGAGKSTIARHLAHRFGLLNIESGAMYRAFALQALRKAAPLDECAPLERLARETTIYLEPGESGNRVFLDGEDVTALLRDAAVTDAASRVSIFPPIRTWMVHLQQQLGAHGGVVMEGRDIGTVVFPQADVKIFLEADPTVRGQRRVDQLGEQAAHKAEEVVRELRERDRRDRGRADSPLKPAEDAVEVDTTHMTLNEVLAVAEGLVAAKLAEA